MVNVQTPLADDPSKSEKSPSGVYEPGAIDGFPFGAIIVFPKEFPKVLNSGSVDQQYSQQSPGFSVASLSIAFPNQVLVPPLPYACNITVEPLGDVSSN